VDDLETQPLYATNMRRILGLRDQIETILFYDDDQLINRFAEV
jgi:hypothetical protein